MKLVRPSYRIETNISKPISILKKLEKIGRVCYKSESKITKDSYIAFLENVIKRGHESVLEHFSITVRFICDRGIANEIVRHRLASFCQESTRYCSYKNKVTFVIPPWIHSVEPGDYSSLSRDNAWLNSMLDSENSYIKLIEMGWTPQQARSVLPTSVKTEVIVTANFREWRHILSLRTSKSAHPQMVELMTPLLTEFKDKFSILFSDI